MSPESLILAGAWLKKASSDLAAASILIHGEQKHLDVGSYHCQQAAEKAIKAYLTARETLFPKTHSLEQLLDLCASPADTVELQHAQAVESTRSPKKSRRRAVRTFHFPQSGASFTKATSFAKRAV